MSEIEEIRETEGNSEEAIMSYIKSANSKGVNALELFISQSLTKTSMISADKAEFYTLLRSFFFGLYVSKKRG